MMFTRRRTPLSAGAAPAARHAGLRSRTGPAAPVMGWQQALKCSLLAACVWALTGCGALHSFLQNWRPGQDSGMARQRADPARQQQLDALYAEGVAALADNRLEATVAAWRRYIALAPAGLPQAHRLRGYVTLLERESARRFARQAAAGERQARPAAAAADRLHVALFPLQSRGPNAARDSLNRALLAMITADLAKVPSLTVLERERIDALLREQQLAASGLVDPATLAAPARLLGAGSVVAGAVYNEPGAAGPGSGRYKINTAVSDVADGRVLAAQEADGRQADFFRLQKEIVHGILKALDVREIPPSVNRVHTRSWAAYVRFAAGLELLGEDRFDAARAAFREALALDPAFALAEQALLDTPDKPATVEQIRAELRR
jgi:TolB-like protein